MADKDEDYIRSFTGKKDVDKDFPKEIVNQIELLWKDIYDYENGGFWKWLLIYIKSVFKSRKATCNVPHDVIESLAATFLPGIRAFFESEEGKKEFTEWKEQQKLKEALDDIGSKHMFDNKHCFIYPFMQQLLEYSIKMNSEFAGALLQRSIEHNQNVFTKLTIMIGEAFDSSKECFNCNGHYKVPVESVVKSAKNYFQFDSNDGFLSYMFVEAKYKYPRFCTNVVRVNAKSDDPHINSLIYTLNEYYEQIRDIQPVTSDY